MAVCSTSGLGSSVATTPSMLSAMVALGVAGRDEGRCGGGVVGEGGGEGAELMWCRREAEAQVRSSMTRGD